MQKIISKDKNKSQKKTQASVSKIQTKPESHADSQMQETGVPFFLHRFAFSSLPLPVHGDLHENKKNESATVFPKLTVGPPDDDYEQEADYVAEIVMSKAQASHARIMDQKSDEARLLSLGKRHQGKNVFHSVQQVIESPGGGSPLPESTRSRIESVVNFDLHHVKVHSNDRVHEAAHSIHAKAFTHQNHIFLGKGQSISDVSLMAHEAAHVAQQHRHSGIPGIQRFLIPEELRSCMNYSALSAGQLRSRLELVESTLAQAVWSTSEYAMLERERSDIIRELARPERGGPESASREGSDNASAGRWTHPPTGITSARNLRIMANPERHPEVVGTQVRYWYGYHSPMTIRSADSPSPPSYVREVTQNWRVVKPDGQERDLGTDREITVDLNIPGRWEIGISLSVRDGSYSLWYQHDVIRPSDIARNRMAQTNAEDFIRFRARLEQERLRLERFSEWGAVNSNRERPFITCSQPNPAGATTDPEHIYHQYTINPSPDASRYRWYVRSSNWENTAARMGYRRARFGEASFRDYPNAPSDIEFERRPVNGENAWVRPAYLDTTYRVFTFIVIGSGYYTVVCEELDSSGNPTGQTARYVQIVLPPEEMSQVQAIRRHIRLTDENIAKIREGSEAPIRAVYVNNETGRTMALSMYIGPDREDEDKIKLLDLTPGVGRMEYDGDNINDALDTFNSGNAYPTGLIHLEIPPNEAGIHPLSRRFETTGSSDWSDWSSGTGWAALTLGILGVVATFAPIPGSRVIAGICFIGAAALGGTSAGLSLYDRLQQAEIDETGVAIDVLGIASSIIGGASAFRALRHGATVALGTRTGRFLLWTGFGTDMVSGTLLTIQGVNEINQVMASDAPRGEKIGAIVRILSTLALNGGLLVLSVRDLRTARGRIGGQIGSDIADGLSAEMLHRLNLLDDGALRAVRGASSEQLEQISDLIVINRDAANKLVRSMGTDVLDHTVNSVQGGIRINNQLDIHPGRLVQIADDDLATIVRATGQSPVDTVALAPFTQSGSYRLRFRYQLMENENWLIGVIDDAGLSAHPEARRLLAGIDDAGRIRLQEARGGSIPAGVRDQLESQAAGYALNQRPPNIREFVNHYEMYISEFNRQRILLRSRIRDRIDALMQATPNMSRNQANRQASREILGIEVQGFKKDFNLAVLNGPATSTTGAPYQGITNASVSQRAAELSTHLAGRSGPRRVGLIIDPTTLGSRIQTMRDLQFGSESSAVYHTNKHTNEMPHDHQLASFGTNPVDRYLRSANETIRGGQAQVIRNQDGSFNVTVTRRYGTVTMRAILRVSESGQVLIATYGKG
ncbi:eCIS core domain-containing protein [Desulfobacter sp.]